jgi:hypothetical protein
VIGAFLAIQLLLLVRAALPLPEPLHGPWPWRMFDRRGPWERRLEAIGTTPSGHRWKVPLEQIFTYSRGFTPLRAYDQLEALNGGRQQALQAGLARYLAERMAERGVTLTSIELAWIRTNLDDGQTQRRVIGTFPLEEGR